MAARIINGSEMAARIREATAERVAALKATCVNVRLDAIIVGDPAAGVIYARSQEKRCAKVGVEYRLHTLDASIDDDHLQNFIEELSHDDAVTGVMLNLPLPEHLDTPAAQYAIDPYKDVEGVNPANIGLLFYGTPIIAPCTALAVMAVLQETGVDVRGKDVCIVGQGSIVGKPIALSLMCAEATVRTCNKYTPDLAAHTADADIVIAAAGVPGLIGGKHVKEGAIVIDVGINSVPDPQSDDPNATRVVGDVKFDEVVEKASAVTPVPGGVGPVTVAILLQNAAEAAAKQHAHRRIHPH
ncbi:MAG: bifunctional 5,10-methylenetetrahydrofolate dehydrogenase/5,10-methenyltetrahydrofolate cyclohydrolase [Phycisphaerales bacterium]|nr:bifunctional 5,10-methylenetetrahydrofolate dehydrogenase/5,10-methenyltetrahydrofolate cyclohydrolase [Phycisphaerales bacterium]